MNDKKFSEIYQELYNTDLPISEIKMGYNNLVYLSWNCAFDIMTRKFDDFEVIPTLFDGKNYFFQEGVGAYVETTIKAGGFVRKWSLPVMDSKNQAILKPNTRDINDTIMRCAVKTIALFGLGMKLYIKEEAEKIARQLSHTSPQVNTFKPQENKTPAPNNNTLTCGTPIPAEKLQEIIDKCGSNLVPSKVSAFFAKKNWMTSKGQVTESNVEYFIRGGWIK